jgi:calcium/calmodulin-dependent 3',5'-cyclic nucleotide phosphodiesterase
MFLSVSFQRMIELTEEHRSKALCFLLHSADISNPAKPWEIHTRWTARIMEEFFQQGDREKQLSLPISPLCDRNTTSIPGSQLGNYN